MGRCVRCGLHLDKDQKLWCEKCSERVDEELRGEISRSYEYYFRHHLKQMRKERDLFGLIESSLKEESELEDFLLQNIKIDG